jgi:polyhydroxyalkanoate synthase subunit PhaC
MAEPDSPQPAPAAPSPPQPLPILSLEDMQHWTWVMGRTQQMMLEAGLQTIEESPAVPIIPGFTDPRNRLNVSAI